MEMVSRQTRNTLRGVARELYNEFAPQSVWLCSCLALIPPPTNMPLYNPDKWIEQLKDCQHLQEAEMRALCERVRAILMEESNIQPVSSPVTICGDIHGQFWDLLELLRKGGDVPETSYIFMARMSCLCCG